MDLATFRDLLRPEGQSVLRRATELAPTGPTFLACFQRLRKHTTDALAKAALETVLLRQQARPKFPQAEQLYFTREALEQASGAIVSGYRAGRLAAYECVADLCCGIGGDTLGLAQAGRTVLAVETDPLRAAMTTANVAAVGLADRVQVHQTDALTIGLPAVQAVFADPSRRAGGTRQLDPEHYLPPLSAVQARWPADFPLAVKIAPGVPWPSIAQLNAEVEFIAVAGELKECVLWFGPLRTARRRATLLPAGVSLAADTVPPLPPLQPVNRFVFDPDPAIVRAGLTALLAQQFHLHPVDPIGPLLTGPHGLDSPLVTAYAVEWAERYHPRRLRDYLRQHHIGRVTPVQIGSRLDPREVMSQLKFTGSEHRLLLLTRVAGTQWMLIAQRLQAPVAAG
jgi:SAM-dependent methyltransferase